MIDEGRVRLTDDRYWHIKKRPIPRYNEEHLGNTELALQNILYFTIEEYQPLVYLVTGSPPRRNDR